MPQKNIQWPRPSDARKMKEKPFSAIFCIKTWLQLTQNMRDGLLHLNREFMLIRASYCKKEKEEFLFSYKWSNISNTNYKMDLLLSFTVNDLVLIVWSWYSRTCLFSLHYLVSLRHPLQETFAKEIVVTIWIISSRSVYWLFKSSLKRFFAE